jgi:hypothetical protein
LCNNLKFALELCGWGILHFCDDVDFLNNNNNNSVNESTFDKGYDKNILVHIQLRPESFNGGEYDFMCKIC